MPIKTWDSIDEIVLAAWQPRRWFYSRGRCGRQKLEASGKCNKPPFFVRESIAAARVCGAVDRNAGYRRDCAHANQPSEWLDGFDLSRRVRGEPCRRGTPCRNVAREPLAKDAAD